MGEVERVSDIITSDYNHLKKDSDYSHYNHYDFGTTKRNKSRYTAKEAQNKAGYLADKLKNEDSLYFYLKCAWNLTDQYLDRLLEIALTKEDGIRYFSFSAAREMEKNRQ